MAVSDLLNLAEAQREALRALATLIEQLSGVPAVGGTAAREVRTLAALAEQFRGAPATGGAATRGSEDTNTPDSTTVEVARELTVLTEQLRSGPVLAGQLRGAFVSEAVTPRGDDGATAPSSSQPQRGQAATLGRCRGA